jgi:hypothetical protein
VGYGARKWPRCAIYTPDPDSLQMLLENWLGPEVLPTEIDVVERSLARFATAFTQYRRVFAVPGDFEGGIGRPWMSLVHRGSLAVIATSRSATYSGENGEFT